MARTAVVSGGGTGIGYAVAERFAKDGDRVVVTGRREAVLREAAERIGERASYFVADLAEPDGARRVADHLAERFGGVDIVAACAGGMIPGPDTELGLDGLEAVSWTWAANLRANVMTAVHLVEATKPHLNDGGRILLCSSIAALRGSGNGSYGASKAALHPYAIDLSAELGHRGVTANVIAPGYTADTEFFGGRMTAERHQRLIGQTHNKRAGNPADIAELAHWLAAPGAGNVTAQVIQSNGGALPGR